MTRRPCLECGAPTSNGPRCRAHTTVPAKAPTASRGYGGDHQAERERQRPFVESGAARCTRCGKPIRPGEAWALDHDDNDRSRYLGPAHARCNSQAGGRKSRRARGARR